uniref:GIT1_C domain-containing protein n=1 Tax=Macrostomum lignano TaxID=282301 RepID=A0A1I8G1S7_9PLAT
ILQPVASLAGATSAVTAASEQTGELTALRTMNARLAEENRQLRQRVDQLMAQNSDLSARLQQLLAARSVPASQPPAGSPTPPTPPPPLSPASSCMARPTPVVPPTVPESSAVDEAAAAEARSDGDGEGEVDADVLTPVGQQLDINVDEVNCVDIDFDNLEAAEGGGAAACSAAAAATAVDDGDADYDQPPAETDEEDDEMCNERRPPTQEEVVARTEAITSEIYKMLEAARSGSHENFSEQSGRVRQAVLRMTAIAPRTQAHQRQAVDALLTAADTLSAECRSPPSPSELSRRTQQVIQCCFDIAKAAKALVTLFQ